MNIKIVCIGKIKESYLKDAIKEYSKRLSRYCTLSITELDEEKITIENPSNIKIVIDKEGERILKNIDSKDYVILLDREGKELSSIELSSLILSKKDLGTNITFIIGGSYGVSENIKNTVNYKLSFSKLTFPHQLFRVNLLEQIYRSFKIINNEKYHK